ncbi:MAG: DNA cytosine methyltransferase [Gemmataceae bacterium]|nr:DNA cytosine methyltransferase [Gemmataceae bacterium]
MRLGLRVQRGGGPDLRLELRQRACGRHRGSLARRSPEPRRCGRGAGRKQGLSDPRSNVLHPVLRILAAKRPRAVVLENVPALVHHAGGSTLKFLNGCLRGLGFSVSWSVLDASSFGSAQRRRRLYVVGTRGRPFDFSTIPTRPARRLAGILDDVDGGWLDPREYVLLDPLRIGRSGLVFAGYLDRPLRNPGGPLRGRGTHRSTNTIWSADGLGPTLCSSDETGWYFVAIGGLVRRLTTPERCRLMGFPPDFRFSKPARATVQLGNSVSVECVAALAGELARQVSGTSPSRV